MASQAKKKTAQKKSTANNAVKTASRSKTSTAKKKVTKKASASRVKRNAGPDQIFVMVDGKRVKNIKELADVMSEIEDYVFNHHVSEQNNDFENWLKHVFEEIALAREIAGCKDKKHVQLVLYKHISHKLW